MDNFGWQALNPNIKKKPISSRSGLCPVYSFDFLVIKYIHTMKTLHLPGPRPVDKFVERLGQPGPPSKLMVQNIK